MNTHKFPRESVLARYRRMRLAAIERVMRNVLFPCWHAGVEL